MNTNFVETCIAERHNYARHIFTALVGWFTFFVTVNYASMGWLSSAADKNLITWKVVLLISTIFAIQNVLGIMICLIVRSYFKRANKRILAAQGHVIHAQDIREDISDLAGQTCLPLRLYSTSTIMMVLSMLPLLTAWFVLPIIFRGKPVP